MVYGIRHDVSRRWVPVEMLYGVLADVRCLWKWCVACQATLGAYGDGVWSVSRCSVLVDMVSGVSGDVGRLWKWCSTGVAYGMYSARSASLSLGVNDSMCSAGKPFGYYI